MNRSRQSRLALTAVVLAILGGTLSCQTWELCQVITVDSPIPRASVPPAPRLPQPPQPIVTVDDSEVQPAAFTTEEIPQPTSAEFIPLVNLPHEATPATELIGGPPLAESSPYRPRPVQIHAVSEYEVNPRPAFEPVAVRPAGMQAENPSGESPLRRRPLPPLAAGPTTAYQPNEGEPQPTPAVPPRALEPNLETVPPPRPMMPRLAPLSQAGSPSVVPYSGWLPPGNAKGIGRVKPISELTISTNPPAELSPEGEPLDTPADLAADALAHVPPYDRENIVGAPWNGVNVTPFGFCYQPLYFEEAWLERYGYSYGVWQPAVSAGRFYTNIALMPIKTVLNPPRRCTNQVYSELPGTYGICR